MPPPAPPLLRALVESSPPAASPAHDLPDALDRLAHVLKPGGWLFANFKLGQGERIDGYGRHYTDMDSELLLPLFGDASGWSEVLTSVQTAEAAFGEPTGWVNLLARKSPD